MKKSKKSSFNNKITNSNLMIALSSLIAISNIFLLTKQKDNESLILLIIISIIVFMTSKKVNIILLLLIPVIAVNLLIMTRNYMLIKLKTQKEGFDQATLNVIKKHRSVHKVMWISDDQRFHKWRLLQRFYRVHFRRIAIASLVL